jgi:hypothetical protein
MTNPTGRAFLSYKRERSSEAELIIKAQHDYGIPTWQDVDNLENKHTATQLRAVLEDPNTANVILWLTPEVATSEMIRQVEAPAILNRAKNGDGFFVLPIAADGLSYEEAADVIGHHFSLEDLREWNMYRAETNPLSSYEAAKVANRVLLSRTAAVHKFLPGNEPLRIEVHTRVQPASDSGSALVLDWTSRFNAIEALPGAWDDHIVPAIRAVANAIYSKALGRTVEASGLCSIPAAIAVGCAFQGPRDLPIAWRQRMPEGEYQTWSLAANLEETGFKAVVTDRNMSSKDLAVLVSVADDVEPAFTATFPKPIPFHAVIEVSMPGHIKYKLASPGQALDVTHKVIDCIRQARRKIRQVGQIHLFMAAP